MLTYNIKMNMILSGEYFGGGDIESEYCFEYFKSIVSCVFCWGVILWIVCTTYFGRGDA